MESIQFSEEQIRERLDDYFATGYNVQEYCFANGEIDEATLTQWLTKYHPEAVDSQHDDAGFMTVNIVERKKPGPKKQLPVNTTAPTLFARIGDIELYQHVSASYLKSLKS